MSLYSDIDALKTSVNETSTETLPPGYIAGFNLSVDAGRILCSSGICNFNGKKVTFPEARYIYDSEWVSKRKLADTVYYIYLTTVGSFFVDLNEPVFSSEQFGDYHPTLGYRYIGKAKTDRLGAIDIVANSKNIIAENIDFDAIEGSRIKAETIESKQLIIGDQTDPVGDPVPDGVELFRYNDLACASTDGTRPVSKNVKLEQGSIGSVENPWYYERRWTVPKGLVAAYTMNAGVGTVLRDDSGNFKDGTISGATWSSSGKQGYCLSFDGTNDWIVLPAITASTTFTISVWVKSTQSDTSRYILDSQTGRFIFAWNTDTSGKMGFYDGAWKSVGDAPDDGAWHHCVLTANGSTGKINIYIDTAQLGVETDYTAKALQGAVAVGTDYNPPGSDFVGSLDTLLIYNRVLTTTEISTLYAETTPYTDVNAAPCDNAIWCGKTTTNLVATTDLSDTKWDHDAAYQAAGYGNVFDPDLLKTVFKWTKGSDANETYLYDNDGATGLAAGTYVMSLMIKCNYAISVRGQFYGSTPGTISSGTQLIPADTWTLATFRFTTAAATYTQINYYITLPGAGNFDSSIEFRACDPYVALESYPMPFAPTTRPAGSLYYNYTWAQQGTIGFWTIPRFAYNKATNTYFISDYNAAAYNIRIWYDATDDKWSGAIDGSTSVEVQGTAITSNADLWKTWFIALTYDVANDSLKLYCYNVDYPAGDNASSTSNLGTVTFEPYLNVGGIPKASSPATFEADSIIAGLFIDDTVWTEAELLAHYNSGRVYYDPNVIQNYSRGVAIDKNGILIKDGSLNIIDNYGREIDISNQSGLMAKDASGQIIHDIPDAPAQSNSYPMGHLYLFKNNTAAYTLWNNAAFSTVTWTTVTAVADGNTNIKGVRISFDIWGIGSAGVLGRVKMFVRPKGSTYGVGATDMPGRFGLQTEVNGNYIINCQLTGTLDVAVDSARQFEFLIDMAPVSTSKILYIQQIGMWV